MILINFCKASLTMRKFIILIIFLSTKFLYAQCDNANLKRFSYDVKSAVISGTGFKFTERVGVTATFSNYILASKNIDKSLKGLLKKTRVFVDLQSIDSKNEIRDNNLKTSLLLHLKPVEIKVKDVKKNQLITDVIINDIAKEVIFNYRFIDNKVVAKADIDVLAYNMENNIKSLKLKCKKLHIGKDGVSKTWSDFDLKVEVPIIESCE